jgi:hypothetical protein
MKAHIGCVVLAKEGFDPLGADPPAVVEDGVRRYLGARNATQAYDAEQARKKREAERPPPRKK